MLEALNLNIQNRLDFQADVCLLQADVLEGLRQLPSGSFRLVISSPPYNIGKEYETRISLEEYGLWQASVISELHRVLFDGGSVVWQVGNYVENRSVYPLDILFYPIFRDCGFVLRNRLIWVFGHGLHETHRFSGRHETCLWFTKGDDYLFNLDPIRIPQAEPGKRRFKGPNIGMPGGNPLGKNPSDYQVLRQTEWDTGILDIPNVKSNHPEKVDHPCQFPVELAERMVLSLSNPNEWVLDPFGGVGSTAIAAVKRQRRCVLIDRQDTYLEQAKTRLLKWQEGSLELRQIGTAKAVVKGKGARTPVEYRKESVEAL